MYFYKVTWVSSFNLSGYCLFSSLLTFCWNFFMSNNLNGFSNSSTPLGSFRISLLTWKIISLNITPELWSFRLPSYRVLLHCILHVNVGPGESFDQNISTVVHLQLATFSNLFFKLLCLVVTQWVVKSINPYSKSVKTFFWAINRQHRGSGVCLGYSSVPLQNYDFSPYLVVNAVPLGQDLDNVILEKSDQIKWLAGDDPQVLSGCWRWFKYWWPGHLRTSWPLDNNHRHLV